MLNLCPSLGLWRKTSSETLAIVDAADFDGTNDSMARGGGLTGAADSKLGIFSAWLRLDGGDGASQYLIEGSNAAAVLRASDNKFQIIMTSPAPATVLNIKTVNTYLASSTWLHILSSWDMGTVGARHLYINDVSDLAVTTFTDALCDYTVADWMTGSIASGGPAFRVNGCLAEFYFATGQYLDFSVTANRRKFISAAGKPVALGATGSFPTGTTPILLHHLDDGEAVANFATNRGSGGSFTITGTLDTASTSPSD